MWFPARSSTLLQPPANDISINVARNAAGRQDIHSGEICVGLSETAETFLKSWAAKCLAQKGAASI